MPYTIDNDTGQILDEAVAKLPSRAERIARYESAMNDLLDPRHAPQPGGPWYDAPVEVRIANMQAAKHGGAYAEAVEMVERGYAIGAF